MKQKSINIVLRSFICLIIIFNNYSLRAQSTAQEFFEDAALCGKNYILIQNFNKDNPIYTDNNIEVTVNSYVSHTSAPIPLLDIITNLSDTNCFKLIDPVIRFDNTTTSWRMYEMRSPFTRP